MSEAWAEFRRTTDPFSVWLDANTTEDLEGFVVKDDLKAAYDAASVAAGRQTMTKTAFGLALKRARKGLGVAQRTVNREIRWVYTGISISERVKSDSRASRS